MILMKKLLLSLSFIVFFYVNFLSQITWTNAVQIDDYAGTYPNVEFDNTGRLYVIRYDIQRDSIMIKKELTPQGVFGNGKSVTNTGTNTAIHFSGSDTINLLVSKFMSHVIYLSTDGGQTFTQVKTVSNSDNIGSPNTMAGYFSQEGNRLRLLYSFVHYNAVVGDKPQLFEISRNGNTWDASGVYIEDGAAVGLFEDGVNVTAVGTRGTFNSSDNGGVYTEINPGAAMADQLWSTGTDSWNGKLYMIRAYSGMSYYLTYTSSDDNGVTWTTPQTPILTSSTNMAYPKIAVKGDTIVAAWLEEPTSQPGVNGYKLLKACYSLDGGSTFSTPDTVFYGTDYRVIKSSFDDNRADFDIANYNDRFVIGYSAVLNNLANNQHTYIRELSFPVPPAPAYGTDVQTACSSYTWIDGNTYNTDNNSATYTYPGGAVSGGDSIVTLNLTILDPATGTDVLTACDMIVWIDGLTYDANNNTATYTIVGGAANGCDSIVTLNLTIYSVNIGVTLNGASLTADASNATYQWVDCDNGMTNIDGATDQTFSPTMNGNYAVWVTENGCTDISSCYSISTIGLSENESKHEMDVYPNPTMGAVTIDLKKQYDFIQVRVLNLTGSEVESIIYHNLQKMELNLEGRCGIYFLEITDGMNKKSVVKLVKEG